MGSCFFKNPDLSAKISKLYSGIRLIIYDDEFIHIISDLIFDEMSLDALGNDRGLYGESNY